MLGGLGNCRASPRWNKACNSAFARMAINSKNHIVDKPDPKARPADSVAESDLNDPKKAPGTGNSPAEDQPENASQSESARDLAEETIDELADDRASHAEKQDRKRELLDGPAELRKTRRDVE